MDVAEGIDTLLVYLLAELEDAPRLATFAEGPQQVTPEVVAGLLQRKGQSDTLAQLYAGAGQAAAGLALWKVTIPSLLCLAVLVPACWLPMQVACTSERMHLVPALVTLDLQVALKSGLCHEVSALMTLAVRVASKLGLMPLVSALMCTTAMASCIAIHSSGLKERTM